MTTEEAERLLEILNVLSGNGRRRGKGLYLARSIAANELKELVKKYGAANVEQVGHLMGWDLVDKTRSPEDWVWQRVPADEPVRKSLKKQQPSITDAEVFSIHSKTMDASRGQRCVCGPCENHRNSIKLQPETSGSKEEEKDPRKDSRWGWLEID